MGNMILIFFNRESYQICILGSRPLPFLLDYALNSPIYVDLLYYFACGTPDSSSMEGLTVGIKTPRLRI
jgi:hypothetical protein